MLLEQSGLTRGPEQLEEAHLILPDTKDGQYRPKLIGWGAAGFLTFSRMGTWRDEALGKGRWKTETQRWPPFMMNGEYLDWRVSQ